MQAYTVGLSINEDLKLRERKGEAVPLEVIYDLLSGDHNLRQSVAVCPQVTSSLSVVY